MKTPRIYIGALAVFCIAALIIGSAGASAMMQKGTGSPSRNTCSKGLMQGEAYGERMSQLLSNLTEKGYDVSAISAAVTSGDYKTAMTLLKDFRKAHPDVFPAQVAGAGKGPITGQVNGERMTQLLANLTEKGYDVSSISAAVTSGDYKTAMTLLKELRTAHLDAFPAHVAGAGRGHAGWQGRVQNKQ
jgi:acetolactate synthase regulatory subunit